MTVVPWQADAADPALVPQVVASYAAYLRAKTHATPEVTVTGDQAELTLTVGDKTLRLAFECHRREWSLRRAELHRSEQAATFTRQTSRRGCRSPGAVSPASAQCPAKAKASHSEHACRIVTP